MSTNPNTVKSQHELSDTNDGKRSSEVLLSTIDKIADLEEWKKDMQTKYGNKSAELEKTKKQLEIAIWALYSLLSGIKTIKIGKSEELIETYALSKIEELNK